MTDDEEGDGKPDLATLRAAYGVQSNYALLVKALRIAQEAAQHEAPAPPTQERDGPGRDDPTP